MASAQVVLMNGTNQAGTLLANTTNAFTLTANAGDSIVLRLGTVGFTGDLELYGPNGAFLKNAVAGTDAELDWTATTSGTFTVQVRSYASGGKGSYVLHLAQFPEAFIVPAGDEGGSMTNGGNHAGTIDLGDLDMWSFTANAGDNIVLRLGTVGFVGDLNLYGPNGALLKNAVSGTDAELDWTATASGTYTALVRSYASGGTGSYVLHLAQFPEAFIVPANDEGGSMTNGGNHAGTITVGDLDMWSFTANAGDNIVLRLGTVGFVGDLDLYGPNGAFLKNAVSGTDTELDWTATTSGTFTALVRSYTSGGTGSYVLHLAQFPEAFIVPPFDEGGPMTNGGNHAGTIDLGDLDMWSFRANAGDNIVLRLGTVGFVGDLNLYGPDGTLLKNAVSGTDTELDWTATTSGTFTALVRSYTSGGTGSYVLHLAQFPEAFIVPANDEGGPMTNGGNHAGTINVGDLDMWSFRANAGDNIVLRLGTVGFVGNLDLYGPDGTLLKNAVAGTDAELDWTATASGTFTALVRSYASGGTGSYVLHLAQFPEAFIVPANDEGGPMTNGPTYAGTIALADEDLWEFTACKGDLLNVRLSPAGFTANLRLYGPGGALLQTAVSASLAAITYTATNCGTFTVLVTSYASGGTGSYGFTVNGLTAGLKLCRPAISGTRLTVNAVGGSSGTNFILYSSTNVADPFVLWTPVLTNQFDQLGVVTYTNVYNPAVRQQYFRLLVP